MTCERALAIREHLKLSDSIYSDYSARASRFIADIARFDPYFLPIKRPRMVNSKLFGRRFLVANPVYESDGMIGYGLNAVAITSIEVAGLASPPIVLTAKRQSGGERFYRSVLEHEFVHICQMLLRLLPEFETVPGGATDFLEARTRAEFEAYYLQNFQWPDLHSAQVTRGMALDEFCCFLSYVHSLENTLKCLLGEGGKLALIADFLANTPARLHKLLRPLGFSEATCQFYQDKFPRHIDTALGQIIENSEVSLLDHHVNFLREWLIEHRCRQTVEDQALKLQNISSVCFSDPSADALSARGNKR